MDTVTLAHRGDPFPGSGFASPCYRIPALTVTMFGRVLVAYDVRADWRDLPGDFDLAIRHSDDHGMTWSEPRALRRHTPGHGFGDASLLTDRVTGRVLCWHVGSTGRSFFSADPGPEGEGLQLWLSVSDDDGESWTHRDLTAHLKPDGVTGMFASSGNGIALASGRLLQSFVLREGDQHWAAVAHSDDGGETWSLGERVGPDCDENKVLGLPNGRVLMHARATPRRRRAHSADDGRTFTDPVPDPALVDPASNGGLALMGDLVVCSMLDDPTERKRLVLRSSADFGHSWSAPILIDAGAAAYSVLAPLTDGALGLVWEAGDYDSLVFARITRDQVTGAVGVTPRQGTPGAAAPPEVAAASQ